jgi:hypothetical protein
VSAFLAILGGALASGVFAVLLQPALVISMRGADLPVGIALVKPSGRSWRPGSSTKAAIRTRCHHVPCGDPGAARIGCRPRSDCR